ncbi:hypothetical protein PDUR_01245 [Paenibacillus durus]|uniref:Uncharacterized protein n=1 Tax=Paenibacillus durus TaxID=44251 RepID=A0A089HK83_PAEDU|nr:hypothetical protein PDUR_01245 [Paenibacillus durus]
MHGSLIYISSLQHEDIINEFENVLKKEKYACFPAPDIKNIGRIFGYLRYHLISTFIGSLLKRLRMMVKLRP